jgi:hypothetical protein
MCNPADRQKTLRRKISLMQRVLKISMAAASLLMCVGAAAAQKADFSGIWTLDKSRSEGLPPGMDQTMTVRQAGDRV